MAVGHQVVEDVLPVDNLGPLGRNSVEQERPAQLLVHELSVGFHSQLVLLCDLAGLVTSY